MGLEHIPCYVACVESNAWLTIPNLLTLLRLVLIVPFAQLAWQGTDHPALWIFLFSGFTDIFDGAIARHFNQTSKWGRLIDPLADKLLTGTAYVVLATRGVAPTIPLWVMWAVVLRDLLILGGSALVYSLRHNSGFKPSIWGKLNTFIEIGVVVWFLSGLLGGVLPWLYILLLVSLLVSMSDYVRLGVRLLRAE